RGFGITLANALRRILLSSLQGAAVTSCHIDGALHEFSSIAGVREDMTDVIINVKVIALLMPVQIPMRLVLRKARPGAVTAAASHIDGVLHVCSSIAGVREDVTDVILNVKETALIMHVEGPKRLVLRKEGPGVVPAGDIQATADVEILPPHHVICTLDEGAE